MSEKNPPDSNFMTKLATFIVDKKTLFFLLYIFAVIFCAFSSGWVNVENDVTTYLPEDTETRQGIVAMNDNFTTFATAQIMVSNVTYETADELSQQIADVEGVSMVTFDDTPDHYTNASALFDISFDGIVSDEISERALSDVEALMDGYDYCVYSDVGYDENATLHGEMSVILIIAVVIIIIVLTLHYYAYTYLLVSSALNSINSELEEMGEIQGAGKAMILRKITLPLVLPAILSAVILTFSKAIGTFGTINYLGSPVQYYTLSSQLYMNINSRDTQTGFAMAILMIIIASIAVFVNQKLIGSRKSYATIGGKGGRSTLIGLGKVGRPVITAALFVFFAVGIIMPIVILVMESFMLKEGIYSLDNFTLHYWIGESNPQIMEGLPGIFKNDEFINSLFNSLRLTLVNGVFGTIFGQLLGYITAKGRGRLHGKLVEQLVFIPYLIPSVAFGGIYLSMFSQPQQIFGVTLVPALYGTFALLTLVSVVKHLPFAARAGTSNMLQISGELEEAATIEGAGFFRRFVKIVFPLSKGGFISGFMLIFVSIMKELDLIILIMTPTTSTLPYLAFRYQNGNSPQASDCVAIVMFSIVFLVYAIANLSGKADLAKSMAG